MSNLRILVLTSSTGGGHDARAEAFAEWCFQLYRHDIDVRIEQMLEDSSAVNRAGVNLYNWIQTKAPFWHKLFYTVVEALSFFNRDDISWFGRAYYLKCLREYRPHLILSVHDCLNRGYFQLARKELGNQVRCATYCGEFSGGWGYSRNWIEPVADLYISRTPTARDYAVKKGMPAEKTLVRSNLMVPRAFIEVIPPAQRGDFRAIRLGLRPDLFTVFLATGGNGANNHFELLPALVRHADRCQAVVVCGRNKDTYNELVHWRANHPEFACYVEAYSDIMHLLMQASDVIVTRGGTTTCAKALHFGCPIIFNAFGGIMPQEQLTWKYFRNGANSQKIENAGDFASIIDGWLEDPASWEKARDNFLTLRGHEDPTLVIEDLVGLANSVAGVRLHRHAFPPGAGAAETGAGGARSVPGTVRST